MRWRIEHEHHGEPLHRADVMLAGLSAMFGSVPEGCGPCLYRYLAESLDANDTREVLAAEIAAIGTGALRPVGRRWIARRVR